MNADLYNISIEEPFMVIRSRLTKIMARQNEVKDLAVNFSVMHWEARDEENNNCEKPKLIILLIVVATVILLSK